MVRLLGVSSLERVDYHKCVSGCTLISFDWNLFKKLC